MKGGGGFSPQSPPLDPPLYTIKTGNITQVTLLTNVTRYLSNIVTVTSLILCNIITTSNKVTNIVSYPISQVVEDFDPEKNGIKANLVSFEMYWFVVQHIQNPIKSLSGKNFYDELTFGMLS